MTAYDFDEITKAVASLWPWYGKNSFDGTMQELVRQKFRTWDTDDLLKALRSAKLHHTDSKSPPWDTIYRGKKFEGKPRRSEFRIMLDNIKRHNQAHGSMGWTDSRAFDHHVAMQTAWARNAPADDGGRRDFLANRWRQSEVIAWRESHKQAGEPVPEFLLEPVGY